MVVRIPRPEDDRFPRSSVTLAIAAGLSLGLGLAAWGMEADRARDAASQEPASAASQEPASAAPAQEVEAGHEVSAPPAARSGGEDDERVENAPSEAAPSVAQTAPEPTEPAEAAPLPIEPAAPTIAAPIPAVAAMPTSRAPSVTLREGRVAYLRCDGLPPQRGPFPCPRDEALERAVWSALHQVERCGAPPRLGHADVVVDLEGTGAPTIRARDTFPSDTARTDDTALLACVTESLSQVRSVLRARRLVVSFRLVLEAPTP